MTRVGKLAAAAVFAIALAVTYFVASRRHVDFSDEGFYYTSAWLAYSPYGSTPVARILMNFGDILGVPYLFEREPGILQFRLLSIIAWYAVHVWFLLSLRRYLQLPIPPWLTHAASLAGLFIFLIPVLSYQNLPYFFVLAALAASLDILSGAAWITLSSAIIPLALAAGVVASTAFAFVMPFISILLILLLRRHKDFRYVPFAVGVAGAAALLALAFHAVTPALYREALGFFNSEVSYTNLQRIFSKASVVFGFLALPAAAGVCLLLACRLTAKGLRTKIMLAACLAGIAFFACIGWQDDCSVTCDGPVKSVIALASFAVAPTIYLLAEYGNRGRITAALLLIAFATELYFSCISNAPLQYNLKYWAPAQVGVLVLLLYAQLKMEATWPFAAGLGLVAVLFGLCIRILLVSHYGGQSIWEASIALHGEKMRGLYAAPSRSELLERMKRSYGELGCAKRFFAAVDSLALPYFLFDRRPPFPHAWVARRVAASRDVIARQPAGCVMMQDRVLPDTPADAETMLGYLRLTDRDHSTVVPLGENIYLIAFDRQMP